MAEVDTSHRCQGDRFDFVASNVPRETVRFLGSEFQLDEDYTLDLNALALETSLARARRAMAEIQSGDTVTVSHVVYPLMQALDIEYLGLDVAVGGLDQRKVHALQRDVLPAVGYEARPAIHTPILAELSTGIGKMSSSASSWTVPKNTAGP